MRDRMPALVQVKEDKVERKVSALSPHREGASEVKLPTTQERIEGGTILEVTKKPMAFEVVPMQYRKILSVIQKIFDASGVKAWAVSGSMARRIHGYATSQPKDIDGFTTEAGIKALVVGLKESKNFELLNELGLVIDEEDLDTEEYGKCKRVRVFSTNKDLPEEESIDIEFFGEGSTEGYGGTSGLDNPAVENKIIRSKVGEADSENSFDIQYFSKEVLTRWYTLVYGREMSNFSKLLFEKGKDNSKLKVKIANRFVALLTLFGEQHGHWPEDQDEQMEYLSDAFQGMLHHIQDLKKYKNLPVESKNIVSNMESYVQMVVSELEVEKKTKESEPRKKVDYVSPERAGQLLGDIAVIAAQGTDIEISQLDNDVVKINLEELSYEELQKYYDDLKTISLKVSESEDSLKLVEFIKILEQIRDNNSPLRNLFIKVPLISHLKAVIAGRK